MNDDDDYVWDFEDMKYDVKNFEGLDFDVMIMSKLYLEKYMIFFNFGGKIFGKYYVKMVDEEVEDVFCVVWVEWFGDDVVDRVVDKVNQMKDDVFFKVQEVVDNVGDVMNRVGDKVREIEDYVVGKVEQMKDNVLYKV